MNVLTRFNSIGKSPKAGVLAVLVGILATLVWVQLRGSSVTVPAHIRPGGVSTSSSVHPGTGVNFQASLSQPMIVQGSDGRVYLDLSIGTPEAFPAGVQRVPTDTIVVLDRSGSMGEDNKWRYATKAVYSLLNGLLQNDRIALITFDSGARVDSRLVWASEENTRRLREIVSGLRPGASTNLGQALLFAEDIARAKPSSERRRRVILLSDGHANTGIVSPEELSAITRRIADRGSIVSTIGMGLGFNETLMASLADHGMGNFSYLEHLESLGTILATELADSRSVYADGSEVRIQLPSGIELVEAAGYPYVWEGRTVVIRTGQLFQGSTKRFMTTLRVANHTPAEYSIGSIDLSYRVNGRSYQQQVESAKLQIACVPPERKEAAVASIDKDVYRHAWIKNNLGSIIKKVGDSVRAGKREEAKELMDSYRSQLDEADLAVPGVKSQTERQLKELEARVDDAFQGRDQKVKQNRAAKSFLGASQELQREVDKNQK